MFFFYGQKIDYTEVTVSNQILVILFTYITLNVYPRIGAGFHKYMKQLIHSFWHTYYRVTNGQPSIQWCVSKWNGNTISCNNSPILLIIPPLPHLLGCLIHKADSFLTTCFPLHSKMYFKFNIHKQHVMNSSTYNENSL